MNEFIGEINFLDWNNKSKVLIIEGFAFLSEINIERNNDIRKSILIYNENKTFVIPTINLHNREITHKYGRGIYNYDYSGFMAQVDLSFIDNMEPLDIGEWKIKVCINTSDIESIYRLTYKDNNKYESGKIIKCIGNNQIRKFYAKQYNDELVIVINDEIFDNDQYNEYFQLEKDSIVKKSTIKENIFRSIYNLFKHLKIKKNRVCFLSDSRKEFSGNFEFIYKEIKSRKLYDIKYILKERINKKKSLKEKIRFMYYISTSKYILLDDYYPLIYNFDIKKEIEIIQLWHATGAFKSFGFSRIGKEGGPDIRSKNHKNYTKATVSSKNIRNHYAEAFGIPVENIVSTGIPRTDIFFDEDYKAKKISELYSKYPILKEKKIIMFAPTFRGNGQKTAYYDFEKLNIEKMYEKLSNNYVIIMKLHPFIKSVPIIEGKYNDFIIDLSLEREINDLLFVSDILITDYSSVCFEYALLNRPMIFFAYDLEEYIASRDFYYPYETFVPGTIARTTEDIIDIVKNNKFEQEKLDKFREKFFDHVDGKSTQRVVETLLKI